jgi:hypothetical protein
MTDASRGLASVDRDPFCIRAWRYAVTFVDIFVTPWAMAVAERSSAAAEVLAEPEDSVATAPV